MSIARKLVKKQTPPGKPGFLGAGHIARAIIDTSFEESDPFILLMDDMLDKEDGEPVGGPHPHAGFETVSLLLEGEMGDEAHRMKSGDLQIMTAGSGIVHTETIETKTRMRLLQLWLNLPKKNRWALPRVQDIPVEHVPTIMEEGVEIRVYMGSFAGVLSPIQNYVPVIIADFQMQPGSTITKDIPAFYSSFLYVISGSVSVGNEKEVLNFGQVGWLNRMSEKTDSSLIMNTGQSGARVVLYAGQPQGDPIVSHGPFIADTQDDIKRLYYEYRQGKMQHISTVPSSQRIMW